MNTLKEVVESDEKITRRLLNSLLIRPLNGILATWSLSLQQVTDVSSVTTNAITANRFIDANGPVKPYKVYSGVFNQTGTAAPVVTNEQNDFGIPFTWTRTGPGFYVASLSANVLLAGKTVHMQAYAVYEGGAAQCILSPTNTLNSFTLELYNNATVTRQDGLLANTYIELRVYN